VERFLSNDTHSLLSNNWPEDMTELGRFTFLRTYAWDKAELPIYDGETGTESWGDCCRRVVEAVATRAAQHGMVREQEFWDRMALSMFRKEWSPPGRGLRFMGSKFVEERDGTPLFNCCFVSTFDLQENPSGAFRWAFLMLAHGAGVGYDTTGTKRIVEPTYSPHLWKVEDSREGKASGPMPLLKAWNRLIGLYQRYVNQETDSTFIVDCMDIQAVCIVAGGTRRSAQLALAAKDDAEFAGLKTSWSNTEARWRWASNHSMRDPDRAGHRLIADHCVAYGEPAPIYMKLAQKYGRLKDAPKLDAGAIGVNPCGEMAQHAYEACNVGEINLSRVKHVRHMEELAEFCFTYCKVVTTYDVFSEMTNEVQRRNRRTGVGLTGVAEALCKHPREQLEQWMDKGYQRIQALNPIISRQLGTPTSIRTTTIKPGGTVPLVLDTTPGCHDDHAPFYTRRVRVSTHSPLIPALEDAGYHIEQDAYADNTLVVSFPVKSGASRGKQDVSLREMFERVAWLQYWWSDNLVSCTAEFEPDETTSEDIFHLLEEFGGTKIKSISLLKRDAQGYEQPPYETITPGQYEDAIDGLKPVQYGEVSHEEDDKFCSGGKCDITFDLE